MVLTRVVAEPKENTSRQFESALRSIVADVRALAGCVRSEWYRDPDAPGRYVMYGAFESMEHFAEYRRSDVVARIGRELLPLLKGQPEFQHYEARVFEQN